MEFYTGADLSSLQAMEDNGAKYFDLDGREGDALSILQKHGVNCVRLRIFNDPDMSFDRGDYCNVENTIPIASRIKDLGIGLFLDFHYSDFWADWQKQVIPQAWRGLNETELAKKVYEYTYVTLNQFKKNNAWPEIVQIGNEIGRGLLWDYGDLEHYENIVLFLNAGLKAVDDVSDASHAKPKTMIHIECGSDIERTKDFFGNLHKHGIRDYDYIGLSYYPFWAGSIEEMLRNCRNANRIYGKKIILTETAFPYTDQSNDETQNVVGYDTVMESMGIEPSVSNQFQIIQRIYSIARNEESIDGVFYWEPAWYQIPGVGAQKGKGNEWENNALFDNRGHALESIKALE